MEQYQLTITIPLKQWVDSLVGTREFAFIDEITANGIRAVAGYQKLAVIEREDNAVDFTGATLANVSPGLYRLWTVSSYQLTENNRRKRLAAMEMGQRYVVALTQAVAEHMARTIGDGTLLNVEQCKLMLVNASKTQLEQTLIATGGSLPTVE